ncbi:MAG TPA: hypothetical protein VHK86_03910 [Nitrososphaera sp.]|jgi:hypothetical protein|nr:hypothetical protein [Nitrososphaera sp.]HEX2614987.1 hypothetical protein [Nitrososphaera sp.]
MKKPKQQKLGLGYIPKTRGYTAVTIKAISPHGEVGIINAFMNENAACEAGDPDWPRERLVTMAEKVLSRWTETYWWRFQNVTLRLAK